MTTSKSAVLLALLATLSVVTAQCPSYLSSCNGACYDPKTNSCPIDDYTAKPFLCGLGFSACNGACYLPTQYHCQNGALQPGPATKSPVVTSSTQAAAPSSTTSLPKSTTSSTQAASSSSTVSPTKATTSSSSSTQAVATSSTTSQPKSTTSSSSQAAATTAAQVCNPTGCGVGLCNCNGACFTLDMYCCVNNVLTQKQFCPTTAATTKASTSSTVAATSSSAAPAPSSSSTKASTSSTAAATTAPVNVNPLPAPSGFPKQTADLRIINSCKTTLWFEARYGNQGAPLPGQIATSVPAPPGSYIDYTVPDTGLPGSRFWAKYGCDSNGKNCAIGDQMQYWPNPPGGCPANGCTPPVDSLFEATWGCRPGAACNAANPTTWFDTSQVDGWTIPYKLTPNGDTSGCDCIGTQCGFKGVDASTLDLAKCPKNENLVAGGQTSVNVLGSAVNLSSVDLRIIKNNQVLGCMSPCKRLNWGVPYGLGQDESSGSTLWMCCPTPTPSNCSPSNGCLTPDVCRAGPIEFTQFVAAVHAMAPGVYSYSYDDGVGLHACPAGVTTYTMEFCPAGSAQYPLQL